MRLEDSLQLADDFPPEEDEEPDDICPRCGLPMPPRDPGELCDECCEDLGVSEQNGKRR